MPDQSKSNNNLIAALIAAQRKFAPAIKTAQNPFFKNKYVPLEGVYDACNQALWDNGLTVVQITCCREGATYLITQLWHISGEHLEGEYPLQPSKPNDPQMLGAALTYARRYGLKAILGIAEEDDDGETTGRGTPNATPPKPAQAKTVSEAQWPGSCPDHKKPFRPGKQGGWYCPMKTAEGWCKRHPEPKVAEVQGPEAAPDENSESVVI